MTVMKYFAEATTGKFLGGFEDCVPDVDYFEVPMPDMGGAYWVNGAWDYTIPMSASVRQARDELLAESDISVLPDRWASMTQEQQSLWSLYRQNLRDITNQNGFPFEIAWPAKP
jgi:hypothetical protein